MSTTTTATAAPRHRRLLLLLASATVSAGLLAGCGDDGTVTGTRQVDPATASTSTAAEPAPAPATPSTPAEEAAPSEEPTVVPAAASTDDAGLLDSFPIAAGWAEDPIEPGYDGLVLDVAELENDFATYTCEGQAPVAETTGTLAAEFFDVESYASREVLVLADADAAVAHLAELRAFYETCPRRVADGRSYPVRVLDTDVGGASFGAVRTTVSEAGTPEPGVFVMQAVRVGRSILLDVAVGEAIATSEPQARDLLNFRTELSVDVVAAQCAFTEAGC